MKLNFKLILRYAVYVAIIYFFQILFYYSYWGDKTMPQGGLVDLYYVGLSLILLILIKPTRGLSWLLLPVMYLIPYFGFDWGSLNQSALIKSTVAGVILALVHIFWIYKPKSGSAA